jgi:hypothetical protein
MEKTLTLVNVLHEYYIFRVTDRWGEEQKIYLYKTLVLNREKLIISNLHLRKRKEKEFIVHRIKLSKLRQSGMTIYRFDNGDLWEREFLTSDAVRLSGCWERDRYIQGIHLKEVRS